MPSLIGPHEPRPYQIINESGDAPAFILSDHAANRVPQSLANLGLPPEALDLHIAVDIGAGAVTRYLALALDVPAILAMYSRLVIDPNRPLGTSGSIPVVSDGIPISGNRNLSESERQARANAFFWPYHQAAADQLTALRQAGIAPAIVSVHSFTPTFQGRPRPWHLGVLWNEDGRIAQPLVEELRRVDGVMVGENEPYSGRHPDSFSLNHHAEPAGLPHVGIEIRQDLIRDEAGARHWAGVLARGLATVFDQLGLRRRLRDTG